MLRFQAQKSPVKDRALNFGSGGKVWQLYTASNQAWGVTESPLSSIADTRLSALSAALLAEDHVLEHIVNHLRCDFDKQYLSGHHDALEPVRWQWKNTIQPDW
jgi:hypothetical protein